MKPSQEYLEPNEKTSQYGWPVVHRQKNPPNWAEWAVCANSYLKIGWFFKLVLCNFRTCSVAINDISRNFSWLLIFRSCSFKNRRELARLAKPAQNSKLWWQSMLITPIRREISPNADSTQVYRICHHKIPQFPHSVVCSAQLQVPSLQ